MNNLVYIFVFFLMCILNYITYKKISRIYGLSEKQKSYILSIKASLALSFMGIYHLYNHLYRTTDEITNKTIDVLQILTILYFTSYLVSDIVIGKLNYHTEMRSLSGYIHHYLYIYINTLSLFTGNYNIFVLFLIEEIPTFLLGIGSFNPKFRNNKLFGLVFLITRIIYHSFLTYYFMDSSLIFYASLPILFLHLYWFYIWVKKYMCSSNKVCDKASKTKSCKASKPKSDKASKTKSCKASKTKSCKASKTKSCKASKQKSDKASKTKSCKASDHVSRKNKK